MPIDNTVQLTRIVAPNLSEIDYGRKLQEVFDNINENFKKVATMPFVQGVQGDSYTLVVKHVFEKVGSFIQVTNEGAELLNSMFKEVLVNPITPDTLIGDCKRALDSLNLYGVNVLDIFNSVESDNVCNNLYFYAIIDDMGQEHDKYLGQLYYFVDSRVSAVANARAKNTDLDRLAKFSDFSGFYMYDPSENAESRYFKTDILPTIYYDSTCDDICWKLNGKNTGISAVGAKGEDGTDAVLQFVKCEMPSNPSQTVSYTGAVKAVFDPKVAGYWSTELKTLEDGLALIYIVNGSVNPPYDYAFGSITVDKSSIVNVQATAYWSSDTTIQGMVTETAIISFFDRVGRGSGASIKALRIPAKITESTDKYHTLGLNNADPSTVTYKDVLIQRQYDNSITGLKRDPEENPETGGNIIVDNYKIKLERQTDVIGSKPSVILSDTDIELNNGTSTKIKLSNGDGNVLEVRGGVDMNPGNGAHFTTDVRFAGQTAFTLTSGQENDLKPLIINASQVTIGRDPNKPRLNVLGEIQAPVIKNTISYIDTNIFFKPNTWGKDEEYDKSKFVHNIVAKGSGDSIDETIDGNTQYGGPGSHIMLGAETITLYKETTQRYKTNVIARADVYMADNQTRAYGSDGTPGNVPDYVACLSSVSTVRKAGFLQFIVPDWTTMGNLWLKARGITQEGTGRSEIYINYINIPWEYLASNDYSYIVYNKATKEIGCIYNLDQKEKDYWTIITQDPGNYNILGITGRMGIYLNGIYFNHEDIIPRIAIINPIPTALFRFFIYVYDIQLSSRGAKARLRIGTWVTYTNSGKIFQSIYSDYGRNQIKNESSYEYLVATDSGAQGHVISQNPVEDM